MDRSHVQGRQQTTERYIYKYTTQQGNCTQYHRSLHRHSAQYTDTSYTIYVLSVYTVHCITNVILSILYHLIWYWISSISDLYKFLFSKILYNKLLLYSIIIIIRKGRQCKAGRERLTPYQSEDPNPTIPTYRMKEEKGKTVGDKKWASS